MQTEKFHSKEDYLTFLAIYVSNEDYQLKEVEVNWMKKQFGLEKYDKYYRLFLRQSDFANLQDLLQHKSKFFPGPNGTQKLLDLTQEVFHIDGEYSRLEMVAFTFLKRYFDQAS